MKASAQAARNAIATAIKPKAPGSVGTQAIQRAVAMLKVIASAKHPGITLDQVSSSMQLSRSTTHRILKCLVAQGLLDQNADKHHYTIGRLTYELSLSVVHDFEFAARWSGLVDTVARQTMHTSYLLARSGTEAICIQKVESRATLRVVPVEVGQRRPLGVGAGALALLASFPPAEMQKIVRGMTPLLKTFPFLTPESVLRDAMEARDRGYAISRGRVIAESVGIGILLPDNPTPHLALSIAAPASAMSEKEIARLAGIMMGELKATVAQGG